MLPIKYEVFVDVHDLRIYCWHGAQRIVRALFAHKQYNEIF